MQVNLAPCFTAEELPLAARLLAAKAKRHGVDPSCLLRAAVRDLVFDEAGRPDDLTEASAAAAEVRADAAASARLLAATTEAPTE